MSKSTLAAEVADYVAAVRAALHDLSEKERDEATQDLEAHLAEVAAELGDDAGPQALRDRLGPPDAYAEQLREAVGYDRPEAQPTHLRLAIGCLVYTIGVFAVAYVLLTGQRLSDEGSAPLVLAFGTTLAGAAVLVAASRHGLPAWLRRRLDRPASVVATTLSWPVWVLRAVGVSILFSAFVEENGFILDLAFQRGGGTFRAGGLATGQVPPWDYFVYWPIFQSVVSGAVLVISLVLSIGLGLRGRTRRRDSRILTVPINLALIATIPAVYLFGPFFYA